MARRNDMKVQREDVIQTALAVLDEVGLDALTMRRLAEALKIQAPSLYWHFPDKKALLDGMADVIIGKTVLPRESGNWQAQMRAIASSIRKALLTYRDGARVYAGTYLQTENILRVSEACLAPLIKAGASPNLAVDALWALFYYILAFAIEEQAGAHPHRPVSGKNDQMKQFRDMTREKYPYLTAVAPHAFDVGLDARFNAGIDLIIAGVNAKIGPPKSKKIGGRKGKS